MIPDVGDIRKVPFTLLPTVSVCTTSVTIVTSKEPEATFVQSTGPDAQANAQLVDPVRLNVYDPAVVMVFSAAHKFVETVQSTSTASVSVHNNNRSSVTTDNAATRNRGIPATTQI